MLVTYVYVSLSHMLVEVECTYVVLYYDYNYILVRCIGQGTASGCMDV